MKHHPNYSPSSLDRRRLCPASMKMEAEAIAQGCLSEDSEYAEEGIFLHKCAQNLTYEIDNRKCDDEQKELVSGCIEFTTMYAQSKEGAELSYEVPVEITGSDFSELTFGTIDVLIIWPDKTAVIVDYKFGRGEVPEAKDNLQLKAYALGVMQKFGVDYVEAHILQPRLKFHSSHTFRDAGNLLLEIEEIKKICESDSPEFCPGIQQCKYCAAQLCCPESIKEVERIADTKAVMKIEHITDITDEKTISELYSKAQLAKKIISAIEFHAKDFAVKNGGKVGNYVIKAKSGARKIEDASAVYNKLSNSTLPLGPSEFASICTVSVAKLEKTLADVHAQRLGLTKKEIYAETAELIGDLITHNEPSVSLVEA